MTPSQKQHLFRRSRSWRLLGKYIFFMQRLFYKSIVVVGREKIPRDCPVIFAPNHQNALMDPLAVLLASDMQTVFLARADIFRKPLLAKIFTWLKILPVYRIRDGKDNLQNNEQSFDAAIEVLEHGQTVGIFPEAAHSDKRSLLPLKKGVPRVAFLAEEKNDFKLGLKIVPVGIYYSRYDTMGGVLHVRFGEAIAVAAFEGEYRENPQKAHLMLRDAIAAGIRSLAIDIRRKGWYESYESMLALATNKLARSMYRRKNIRDREFLAQKQIIDAHDHYMDEQPAALESIKEKVETYELSKQAYRLSDKTLYWRWPVIPGLIVGSILTLAGLPLFIYGFINNIVAYFLPRRITRMFKDKQFHSSVKFLWGALVVPLIYFLQAVIVWIVFGKAWIAGAYLLTLPFISFYAHWYAEQLGFMSKRWRLFFLRKTHPTKMNALKKLQEEIIRDVEEILLNELKS